VAQFRARYSDRDGSDREVIVKRQRKGPQEGQWITLRLSNIDYVAGVTGRSKKELKELLENAKKKKKYEVNIPLNIPIFTREER
jgi:hypothetical protein